MGIFGWSATKVKALAVLLVPVLWTMVLEAGTIACFEYAFAGRRLAPSLADSQQTSFAGLVTAETGILPANSEPDNEPPKGGRKTKILLRTLPANLKARTFPANVIPIRGKHPVISALEFAGKSLSNEELADAMGVCGGESTKRRREVAHLLEQRRHGHCVLIGLKSWQQATA